MDSYFYRDRSRQDTFECDWLSGCFLLARREALEEVGSFDEGFGKYFEDVDMCLRMARAGWKVMYHGGTYACHLEQPPASGCFPPTPGGTCNRTSAGCGNGASRRKRRATPRPAAPRRRKHRRIFFPGAGEKIICSIQGGQTFLSA